MIPIKLIDNHLLVQVLGVNVLRQIYLKFQSISCEAIVYSLDQKNKKHLDL